MRIAFVTYEFPPDTLGGIASYAQHTVGGLAERGHQITVFCGGVEGSEREERSNVRVLRLPCADRRAFHAPAAAAVAREHALSPFDVAEVADLYAEGHGLRAAAPSLPIVVRGHSPAYIAWHVDYTALPPLARGLSAARRVLGGARHRAPWRRVWREARERASFAAAYDCRRDPEYRTALEADIVAPLSHALARRLQRDWRLPAQKLRVVPYAFRPDPALLALPPPKTARTIAFHGSVRYLKGVHVLLRAMRRVRARHPEVRLVLAGKSGASPVADCSWRAWRDDQMLVWHDTVTWLQPALAALGDRVTLRGFLPPAQIPAHLAEADLCVFPSLFDNSPGACLEAMAAARPIVGTRSGGMEEMLGAEHAGLLVAPGDEPALAAAICRLLEEPALRERLARAARAQVLSAYSPDTVLPQLEAVFADAIARRRGARPEPAQSITR